MIDRAGPAPTREEGGLVRHLGVVDAASIFVGIVLGSGIFVAPAAVAAAFPSWTAAALVWAAGAVVAACGAFTYAECASRLPRSGGFFVFYREVYGEALAFVGGWVALLVTYPASVAAIALIHARYLREAVGPVLPEGALAALALVLAALLNAAGLRTGPRTQRTLTAAKVAALAALCVGAAVFGGAPSAAPAPSSTEALGLPAILGALLVVMWTYDGWSDITLVAGEIRDPRRNIGRAVAIGVGVLVLLYAGVQMAVLSVLPAERAAASSGVVAEAVAASLGPAAGRVVAVLVVVTTFGSIHAILLAVSRLGFAMARAGVFPAAFGAVHPRWGTPARATAAIAASTLAYVASSSFRDLLGYFTFAVWIFYGLSATALLLLRRRGIGDDRAWRAPGGILPPIVVIGVGLAMTVGLVVESPRSAAVGAAVLLVGFPVWAAWRGWRGASGSASRSR